MYLNTVTALQRMVDSADLNDPGEFHGLLWMIVQLGAGQKFIAYDQGASPSVVSRWVLGDQTPVPDRRRGILMSAAISLEKAIEQGIPVPLRSYHGRRAPTSPLQAVGGAKDRNES